MGKVIWEVAKFVGTLAISLVLLSLSGGYPANHNRSHNTGGGGPRPRVYAPTGRSMGYGPRTYKGDKWYS